MSDFAAFIPVVNRFDLLGDALKRAADIQPDLNIIDNSPDGDVITYFPDANVYRSPIPLSFSQSMNLEFEITLLRQKDFLLHMHSDSIVPEGAISSLLDRAREIDQSGRRWGVIYTNYDVLCVYNPRAYSEIGGFDTFFPAYFSDNDWYRRLELASYERINTPITVGHHGSQTINSDRFLQYHNGVTFPLLRQYYVAKWGGEPGDEKYVKPFNSAWNKIIINRRSS